VAEFIPLALGVLEMMIRGVLEMMIRGFFGRLDEMK